MLWGALIRNYSDISATSDIIRLHYIHSKYTLSEWDYFCKYIFLLYVRVANWNYENKEKKFSIVGGKLSRGFKS